MFQNNLLLGVIYGFPRVLGGTTDRAIVDLVGDLGAVHYQRGCPVDPELGGTEGQDTDIQGWAGRSLGGLDYADKVHRNPPVLCRTTYGLSP